MYHFYVLINNKLRIKNLLIQHLQRKFLKRHFVNENNMFLSKGSGLGDCLVIVNVPTLQLALGSSFHTKRSRKVELERVKIVSLNFSFSEIQLSLKFYFVF